MSLDAVERSRIKSDFANFDKVDSERRSPLYIALARHIAANPDVLDLFETVPETRRKPVLLFAAVHFLVLRGDGDALTHIYQAADDRRAVDRAGPVFLQFLRDHEEEIISLIRERAVQTNEVNRCVALLPALMTVHRERRKPLALLEIGASAGLNLLFDRYRYDYAGGPVVGLPGATVRLASQLRGRVPRMDAAFPPVDFRIGVDLEPVDLNDEDAVLWLRACIWVGDVTREQRFTAAVSMARRERPDVIEGDALQVLPDAIARVPDDLELCIYSSWTMWWMQPQTVDRIIDVLGEAGKARRIWLITFEEWGKVPGLDGPDGHEPGDCLLGLQYFGPDRTDGRVLASAHPHGAWLDWVDAATSAW